MMASARSEVEMKDLTCGVCRDVHTSPRLLPCFHTFCHGCIQRLCEVHHTRCTHFPCPTCRNLTLIPDERAAGFQRNFYITDSELRRARPPPCTAHPNQRLRYLCFTCSTAICEDCTFELHEDHPTVHVHDLANQYKPFVKHSLIPTLQQQFASAAAALQWSQDVTTLCRQYYQAKCEKMDEQMKITYAQGFVASAWCNTEYVKVKETMIAAATKNNAANLTLIQELDFIRGCLQMAEDAVADEVNALTTVNVFIYCRKHLARNIRTARIRPPPGFCLCD